MARRLRSPPLRRPIGAASSSAGDLLAERGDAGLELVHPREGRQRRVERRAVAAEVGLLVEQADAGAPRHVHLALRRLHLPAHDPQQRGLARAVRTHHANAVAGVHAQRRVLDEKLGAVGLGDLAQGDDGHSRWLTMQGAPGADIRRAEGQRS